jgi:hypothetical protein
LGVKCGVDNAAAIVGNKAIHKANTDTIYTAIDETKTRIRFIVARI